MSFGFGVCSRPSTWGIDTNYNIETVQEVIDFMHLKKLTVYRMCFFPEASIGKIIELTQYFLDQCPYTLLLNYYHNGSSPTVLSSTDWETTTNKAKALLAHFAAYQNRIIIEPYNQFAQSMTQIQQFVNDIRADGYTSKIFCARWYTQNPQDFINILDPLYSHIICGQQQYMNAIGLTGAKNRTQIFIDAGVEVLDPEVGAHVNEYPAFTQALVDDVNSYLAWCNDNGVSACVWLLQGTRDYYVDSPTSYLNLGLIIPESPLPPEPPEPPIENNVALVFAVMAIFTLGILLATSKKGGKK